MSKPVVHQVLIGASEGDAITQMALSIRDVLQENCHSEIFAFWRHGEKMQEECRSLHDIPPSGDIDLMVYHSSIGWPDMSEFLKKRTEKIALVYHNITPIDFYQNINPEFAENLQLGREDLRRLRDRVVVSIAVSRFNAEDLSQYGYKDVQVVPIGFEPRRLTHHDYDLMTLNKISSRFPNGYVVAVGQILPHKRIDQLLQAMHLLNSTYWQNIGLVVSGVARQPKYLASLEKFQHRCAMCDVLFTGPLSDVELSTVLRGARAYIGMSDHEGLCIPPIESMALGIPVVIKGAAAVPETVGEAAVVLPEDSGPLLAAEAIHEVLNNNHLRWSLINRGFSRVAEIEGNLSTTKVSELLLQASR